MLLFLRLDREGNLRVAHLYQGKFSVSRDSRSGQEYATRDTPPGVRILGNSLRAGNQQSTQNEFHRLRDLTDRIHHHLNNSSGQPSRQRLPLSFIPGDTTGTTLGAFQESFTFLGPARWFEPDSGIPISMKINAAGEPLAPTNGFEQVRAAFQAWSSVPESTFRYQDGGFTDAVGGRYDGVNAVSFRDPLGQMDSPVNCSGTLAVGGFIYTTSEVRTINGTTFWRIVDGDLVFNDGWDGCGFFYENFANFTEVATHELGHVLGLGHSSDPSATMYDRAHFDGRGASLGQDDINGLKAIYPNETPRIGGATFVQSIDPLWKVVGVADFNGDGHPDLLWQHQTLGAVAAWYLNGATHIGGATILETIDPLWKVVGVADFNGDGHPDLLWQHQTLGAVAAWYLNGATHIGGATILETIDPLWKVVGVADFNGDGHPDLLWQHETLGAVVAWYLNGATHIGGATILETIDPLWKVVGAADFNGDGHPDLLWQHQTLGAVAAWYLNGATHIGGATILETIDPLWKVVGAADFNGDGHPDLLWQHQTLGAVAAWYLNGLR